MMSRGLRPEEEMKLGWEMQAGHRLCRLVGWGPGTVVQFEGAMTPPRTFSISSRLTACGAALLALTLIAMACTVSAQQAKRSLGSDSRRIRLTKAVDVAAAARQRFLEMFAR